MPDERYADSALTAKSRCVLAKHMVTPAARRSVPESAQRLFADLGLLVFIAIIRLTAGPHAVEALEKNGGRYLASVFAAGAIVTMVPVACGALFARRILKMNPMMMLGSLAGLSRAPQA